MSGRPRGCHSRRHRTATFSTPRVNEQRGGAYLDAKPLGHEEDDGAREHGEHEGYFESHYRFFVAAVTLCCTTLARPWCSGQVRWRGDRERAAQKTLRPELAPDQREFATGGNADRILRPGGRSASGELDILATLIPVRRHLPHLAGGARAEAPLKGIAHSVAYAVGVYLGSKLEARLALGEIMIQTITPPDRGALIAA